nr:hypothetical protein [Anaerolineae bacterium]
IAKALHSEIVPVVYGDVAIDRAIGGTIVSTEDLFQYIANTIQPDRILLAGNYAGVYDAEGEVIPLITEDNYPTLQEVIGRSCAVDVTGGMIAKVDTMLHMSRRLGGVDIQILSGVEPGSILAALCNPEIQTGTTIRHNSNTAK